MTQSHVLTPQHLAFQLQLWGFLVVAFALRGLTTTPGPAAERPLLLLASVGGVIAIAAGTAIRRRWTPEAEPAPPRSTPVDLADDGTAPSADEAAPPRRRRRTASSTVGLDGGRLETWKRAGRGDRNGRSLTRRESRAGRP